MEQQFDSIFEVQVRLNFVYYIIGLMIRIKFFFDNVSFFS